MEKKLDYVYVLKSLQEIPFPLGKKLLVEFLQGRRNNDSIIRNRLDSCDNFGSLAYQKEELTAMIDNLIHNNLIQLTSVNSNKFWKVMEITNKGIKEIENPKLYKKKLSFNLKNIKTIITENDRIAFSALDHFLQRFNDNQKKAIISKNNKILCIAGAGSGKTTVLTKRIEFLVKYVSVDPKSILAITFTRKARQEMLERLSKVDGMHDVSVETFNSFCEKILRHYNNVAYEKPVRVISYKDKIIIVKKALLLQKISMNDAINTYFSFAQKRGRTDEQLANIFLNDCFYLRDYFKFKNQSIEDSNFEIDSEHQKSAKMVLSVCTYIEEYMKKYGLRDFADQLLDTLTLFNKHSNLIQKFEHILIDEYQDINSTQIKLIDTLLADNLFCVGDPRQSIYGWRGSDIKYIINFDEKYPESEIITLDKNYRSTEHIVGVINCSIKNAGLPNLESTIKGKKDITLLKLNSEFEEFEVIIQKIIASKLPKNEIFVLARTNRQLNELSLILKQRKIGHVLRTDEIRKTITLKENEITLATIHAIKGLEAEMVFVIGCTSFNFPCQGSDHPVIDMVKTDEYDKEEEERRLFYVAMSRAKNTLYLSYFGGSHTNFITAEMIHLIKSGEVGKKIAAPLNQNLLKDGDILTRLKDWRHTVCKEQKKPAFIIMHDKTLIDISVKKPTTIFELECVQGIGPNKIMKYGDQILDIVNGIM